ncbi:PREDICTED: tRNA pseudouridine synthase A, mitochondrial-like [Priapulus caudatus]|uniref:tRNA pseudouridine synthase A, mitochondrial-like n=1 Tax=Priapulus caudatus TaxID=37621 RepID=A0ABM1E2H2_PRICU|nr:PREDICTED: tRNA pseudouridine synthase A, mitochondrial-like [Priapulus caudatus]
MFKRICNSSLSILKDLRNILSPVSMAEGAISADTKRDHDQISNDGGDAASDAKKLKVSSECHKPNVKKKKVALLMMYSGVGYNGMQRNPGVRTIENDLLDALVQAQVVPQAHADDTKRMKFQRCARTDKGVSAAGQVVSLKMLLEEDAAARINEHLTPQIRVLGYKRVTQGFNAKLNCSGRTYMYVLPTFAFAPVDQVTSESYRITKDVMDEVSRLFQNYKGTRNFHNFTSGRKADDPSAKRFVKNIEIGTQFEVEGIEFCEVKVEGQSFMLHQIRKMIGLVIAVARGLTDQSVFSRAWEAEKVDIPRAPGLGLCLEKVHFEAYNNRHGSDGFHDPIEWEEYKEEIEKFKHEYIYSTIIRTEKDENSMMQWLNTLSLHVYDTRETDDTDSHNDNNIRSTQFGQALKAVSPETYVDVLKTFIPNRVVVSKSSPTDGATDSQPETRESTADSTQLQTEGAAHTKLNAETDGTLSAEVAPPAEAGAVRQ